MLQITPNLAIDEDELRFDFVTASGPGGQNVNKLATAAQLRFDAWRSPALSAVQRERLARIAGRRMTKEGVIIIQAQRFRSQERNRRDAIDRLLDLLRLAATAPRARRKTRPPHAATLRRLAEKKQRGQRKRTRRATDDA
ncbi:MAG: aminoacyl-tRNA hydrolase [Alphaproteobacteria bacterium]|nr:aminoacyl-tRNA hydrolase [Alphaproteobacteria bacterium]